MPFALLIIGVVLLVSAVRNTQDNLFALVKGDFTGQGNFVFWVASLLIIGAIGYIPKLKPVSDGFLILVLVVLFLTRGNPNAPQGGFFTQFKQALGMTTIINPSITSQPPSNNPNAPVTNPPGGYPGTALPQLGSLSGGTAV